MRSRLVVLFLLLASIFINHATAQWRAVNPIGSVPSQRQNPMMCFLPDTLEVLLYGGATFAASGCGGAGIHPVIADDPVTPGWQGACCFIYSVATNTWRQGLVPHALGGNTGSEVPGSRDGGGLVFLDLARRAVLFGGYAGSPCGAPGLRNDAYYWVASQDSFTRAAVFGAGGVNTNVPGFTLNPGGPSGIQRFAMASLPGTNKVVLYGGLDNNGPGALSRTYLGEWFDAPSYALVWTEITAQVGTLPGPVWAANLRWGRNALGQEGLILNDGITTTSGPAVRLAKHFFLPDPRQPTLNPWTEMLSGGASVPLGGNNAAGSWSVWDPNRGAMIAFGGSAAGVTTSLTSWWAPSAVGGYQTLLPPVVPGSIQTPGIVWLGSPINKAMMFGGNTGGFFTTNASYFWESAASFPYGTACGTPPVSLVGTVTPIIPIGPPLQVPLTTTFSASVPGSFAVYVAGTADPVGVPAGANGCRLFLELASFQVVGLVPISASGQASTSWTLPFDLSLQGLEVSWQTAIFQPGVSDILLSNGLRQRASIF